LVGRNGRRFSLRCLSSIERVSISAAVHKNVCHFVTQDAAAGVRPPLCILGVAEAENNLRTNILDDLRGKRPRGFSLARDPQVRQALRGQHKTDPEPPGGAQHP